MNKTCWMFPGQGTQRRGMGEHLFGSYPGLVEIADDVLGYSIYELCLDDPANLLGTTEYCQPALFIVESLELLMKRRSRPWPDYLTGHSLGEYNALFAAGVFDFKTGLELVRERARCMSENGSGSMLAIIGLDSDKLTELIEQLSLSDLDFANFNLPDQIVVSGPDNSIDTIADCLETNPQVRTVVLNVGGAFHSRYAESAAREFEVVLDSYELHDPKIPTISSVTGAPIEPGTVRSILETQILRPVNWVKVMSFMKTNGVTDAIQIGPGRVLNGLWERNEPGSYATSN